MTNWKLISVGFALGSSCAMGCGLDWTLPVGHFEGVEEHGYVAYWEKIGQVDLGDGLVIPVNIGFNSHREASSPTLGKGWIVALLESHVEPIDENSMNVIMPDGWTFLFYRNGNTETWRGNAGWIGETNNTVFTITAPCGWRVKFDQGKIQEIDTNTNRVLTYRYNGGVATDVYEGDKAFVHIESNISTGVPSDILIGEQKIDITQAQRPQVVTKLNMNFVTGFDQSLNELQWAGGQKETFAFGTDKNLIPSLTITHADQTSRTFTWDADTRRIKTDGEWVYNLPEATSEASIALLRTNRSGQIESYENGITPGVESEQYLDGTKIKITRFTAELLRGRFRKIEITKPNKLPSVESFDYNENGDVIRYVHNGVVGNYIYDSHGRVVREIVSTKNLANGQRGDASPDPGGFYPLPFSENLTVNNKNKNISYNVDPKTKTLIIPD